VVFWRVEQTSSAIVVADFVHDVPFNTLRKSPFRHYNQDKNSFLHRIKHIVYSPLLGN